VVERADLEAAAQAGVIPADRVEPLFAFLSGRAAPQAAVMGEEDLRFIRNFHDVFLAIGIALLAVGFAGAVISAVSSAPDTLRSSISIAGSVASIGVLWLLGEFFARRRRLFLPSIAICVAIAAFAAAIGGVLAVYAQAAVDAVRSADDYRMMGIQAVAPFVAVGAAVGAGAFYARFRLPFALGLTCAALAVLPIFALSTIAPSAAHTLQAPLLLLGGVALFVLGVWFDARDPERRTRLSDNGFWLHLAAAPLLLNGALGLVTPGGLLMEYYGARADHDVMQNSASPGARDLVLIANAVVTLLIVALLGFISVLINRRALIVSALLTTGIAIGMLMAATGLGEGALLAGTLVTLGGFVLVLGASWHAIRRALLRWVKPQGAMARIFPPEIAA